MLSYNEVVPKTYIVLDGEPYEVLSSHVFRKQQRKPVNQTKLRGLKNNKVIERTFHQSETVEAASLEKRDIKYLYNNKGAFWFCDPQNPKDRFSLSESLLEGKSSYLKENEVIIALVFNDEIIGITIPIKMDLVVTDAPPAVKGNTAQGATKQVTLETGVTINAPLFINKGDVVRVNTETGAYVERVEKN
jgi:elongation factor P